METLTPIELDDPLMLKHFKRFPVEVKIGPLLDGLKDNPDLWNEYPERKTAFGSPHSAMTDIWLRWRDRAELTSPEKYGETHSPVWYPARRRLPDVESISMDLMAYFRAVQLGGVLITKIPPGGKIAPHNDKGTWHPEFFNKKIYVPLQSNDKCLNWCEGDTVVMRAGECWSFNNLENHSVENNGNEDRITLIICMRIEP